MSRARLHAEYGSYHVALEVYSSAIALVPERDDLYLQRASFYKEAWFTDVEIYDGFYDPFNSFLSTDVARIQAVGSLFKVLGTAKLALSDYAKALDLSSEATSVLQATQSTLLRALWRKHRFCHKL